MKYALFIGKFETCHEGHQWFIDQKLKQRVPVAIGVRRVDNSSFSVYRKMQDRFKGQADVRLFFLGFDIESINYGRDVGYEVNEWIPPPEIAEISSTKLREDLTNQKS